MAYPEEARDPSMEEILASIRKIIAEDNPEPAQPAPHLTVVSNQSGREPEGVAAIGADPEESLGEKLARKAGAERDSRKSTRSDASAADKDAEAAASSAEMPTAEIGDGAEPEADAEAPVTDVEAPTPISLGPDESPATDEPVREDEVLAPISPEPNHSPADDEPVREGEVAAAPTLATPDENPAAEGPVLDDEASAPALAVAHQSAEADFAVGEAPPDLTAIAAAMAVGNPQPVQDGGRLLSPQADRAVHGAFDQLASTIMNDQARTIEDLVKDMMRPMLQHWLDDNLPVLVERLVREEIERVSRGRR